MICNFFKYLNDTDKKKFNLLFNEKCDKNKHFMFKCALTDLYVFDSESKYKNILYLRYELPQIKKLPTYLKILYLSDNFDSISINSLSKLEHLEELYIGNSFNKQIQEYPPNLKHISFGYNYKQFTFNLPDSVETITYNSIIENNFINKFPLNLKRLNCRNISNQINELPITVIVRLNNNFELHHRKELRHVMDNLNRLNYEIFYTNLLLYIHNKEVIETEFYKKSSICQHTKTIKKITFSRYYNYKGKLPFLNNSIEEIHFSDSFNDFLIAIPDSVKILKFGDKYNKIITKLPENLVELYTGNSFNSHINFTGANKLETIVFGINFNKKIDTELNKLPKSIKNIIIKNPDYKYNIE